MNQLLLHHHRVVEMGMEMAISISINGMHMSQIPEQHEVHQRQQQQQQQQQQYNIDNINNNWGRHQSTPTGRHTHAQTHTQAELDREQDTQSLSYSSSISPERSRSSPQSRLSPRHQAHNNTQTSRQGQGRVMHPCMHHLQDQIN